MKESLDKNYASNADFASEVMTGLLDAFQHVQNDRTAREEVWQNSYRAWSVDQTETDKSYDGMADLKIPQLRKEVETMSRRLYKGLIPEDYLKAEPFGLGDADLAIVNTQLVRHYYDNIIQIKQPLLPWVKQLVLLGTSPMRQYWEKKTNEMFYRKREAIVDSGGIINFVNKQVKEDVILYNAPKLRAEDIFNTWVYPSTANNPKEIQITFWRTIVNKGDLKAKVASKTAIWFDEFEEGGSDLMHEESEQLERLAQFGDSGTKIALRKNNMFRLLEIWCDLMLPGSTKLTPCVVEIVDGKHCIRIQRNPYWHQQTPIDFGRFIIPPPGEFYGRGLPEAVNSLQLQLDDTMNQTMDSTTLALNNITIINPAYAPNAESFEMEPGARWWADPAAVKQFQFPDLSDSGYKAAGFLRSWISELSDNQPQLPDPIAGKARSTGQAQLAVNEWQTDLFTFIDYITTEALSPMAFKTHCLIQQFIDDDSVIKISGRYAGTWTDRIITPEDVVGMYRFKWIGALQIENQAIKTQQMLKFLQVYGSIPQEARAKVRINWENLMIKLLRDGFLIKDIENVIETDRMNASVSPKLEHKILDLGGEIEVHSMDDDALHNKFHQLYASSSKDPLVRAKLAKHIIEHSGAAAAKQQAAQMQAQLMQMQMAQIQGSGPGNKAQVSEQTDQADIERGMRVE